MSEGEGMVSGMTVNSSAQQSNRLYAAKYDKNDEKSIIYQKGRYSKNDKDKPNAVNEAKNKDEEESPLVKKKKS